jgi:malonate-semialdehyde dehydrogenase (acetylating)/methylmalonate-semialdehyde dehydrogenase
MVPNWTIPNAIALGNCMILKPSEKVPISAGRIAELLKEAGLPDGVFNVVHGDVEIVEGICDHPDIQAVSFVGSTKIAKIVYQRATQHYKRCLALGGAKNHLMVMPDAIPSMTAQKRGSINEWVCRSTLHGSIRNGSSGRNRTISFRRLWKRQRRLFRKKFRAVINKESKEKIERYILKLKAMGATVLLDGRGAKVEGKENGTYVGPTVIDHVKPEMSVAKEEILVLLSVSCEPKQ